MSAWMTFVNSALKEGFAVSLHFSMDAGIYCLTYTVTAPNGEKFGRGHKLTAIDDFELGPVLDILSESAKKTVDFIKTSRSDAMEPKKKHEAFA